MQRPTGETTLPSDYTIYVLQHQFFLTGRTLTRARDETSKRRSATECEGARREDGGRCQPRANDLVLQAYSTQIQEEMHRYLPHSLRRDPIPSGKTFEARAYGNVGFEPVRGHFKLWDSGAGSIALLYTVSPCPRTATLGDLRDALDHLHEDARDTWRDEIQAQAAHFRAVKEPAYLQSYSSHLGGRQPDQRRNASSGSNQQGQQLAGFADPLWVHDTIIFFARGRYVQQDSDDAVAAYLTDGGMSHTLHLEDRRLPLRLGLSACMFVGEQSSLEAAERLVETHGAIWAAAIDYDLRLNGVLSSPLPTDAPLGEVEQELDELGRLQRTVSNFTASFSNAQAHLGWADQQLWKALYTSWALEAQLTALDSKLSAVRTFYSELATRISTRRSRRLADFLIIFTFLSAVSAAASITNFVRTSQSSATPSNAALLLIYVVTAAVLAVVLLVYVHRKPR